MPDNYNKRLGSIIPIMPEQRAEFFEELGINVTNPTPGQEILGTGSLPNMPQATGINVHSGMRSGFSSLGEGEMDAIRTVRNQFYRNSEDFNRGIARRVEAPTFGGRPQETAQNINEFIQADNPQLTVFDIETLPADPTKSAAEVSPNTQIPVEMHFEAGQFTEAGRWQQDADLSRTFLIQPQGQHQEVLDKFRRQLDRGTGIRLTENETQTIRRMVRYSDAEMTEGGLRFTGDTFGQLAGEGNLLRQLDQETFEAAEQGYRFLETQGRSPQAAAEEIQSYLQRSLTDETFLGGHNIANFDVPSVERFLTNHLDNPYNLGQHSYIDTLRTAQDIGSGNLGRTLGEQALNSRLTGHTLQDLSDAFDIGEEQIREFIGDQAGQLRPHDAPYDVGTNIGVIKEMFAEGDRALNLQSDINRQIDLTPIKQGDVLFTTRGGAMYSGGEGFESAFEKGLIGFKQGPEGQLVSDRYFLESQAPFRFEGIRQTDDRTVAMLRNLATEEDVFVGHEDPNELLNFVHSRAQHGDDMFPNLGREQTIEQMMEFRDYKMRDVTRSRWRQVMSGQDTDSYDKLRRMLTAYEQEENVLHTLRGDLLDIDQVGPTRANRILETARQGQLNKMDDLQTIRGIGDKVFDNVQRQQQAKGMFDDLFSFQEDLRTDIFAFQKEGQTVTMGRWPEHYRRLRQRIDAEYEPLRAIADRVGGEERYDLEGYISDYGGDNVAQTDEFWRIKRDRHLATSRALQRYRDEVGELTELTEMPSYKRQGIDISTPIPGGERQVTLDPTRTGEIAKQVNLQAQKAREFQEITGTPIDPEQTVRKMFDESAGQLRNQYQLQAQMRQLRRSMPDDPEDAARKLRTAFDRYRNVIPDYFDVDQRIQQLRDTPGDYRQHIREFRQVVSQEQGLDGRVMKKIRPQELEDFAGQIETLGERVGRGELQTGAAGRRFESLIREQTVERQDASPFWAFGQRYREIEDLTPDRQALNRVRELDARQATQIAEEAMRETADVFHAPMSQGENLFRSSFDNQLLDRVDYLDRNLREIHKQLGLERTPPTMRDTLAQFTDELERGLSDEVSYSMMFQGSEQDPRIAMALYQTDRAESVAGMGVEQILDDDTITTFDIPLISEDQYIQLGGQQRVAPPAVLDIDPGLRDQLGHRSNIILDDIEDQLRIRGPLDTVMGDAFDIDHRLAQGSQDKNTASWVIKQLDEQVSGGYHRDAEQFVRKRFNQAGERMAGSMGASYGEDASALYSGFRADMVRKRSIVTRRVFEDMGGTWHDLEGQPLYPGQGLADFYAGTGDYESRGMADIVQQYIGDDVDISIGSTRGKHWTQGILAAGDIRDLSPFSYYTNPARPNIMQKANARPMTEDLIEGYRQSAGISLSSGVLTEEDYAIRGLGGYAEQGIPTDMQVPGVRVPTATIDPSDIYAGREGSMSLVEAIQEADIDEARRETLLDDVVQSPSVWEDQIILSESAAYPTGNEDALIAAQPRQKVYEGILDYDESIVGSELDYGETLGRWESSGQEFTFDYRAARKIDNIDIDREARQTMIDWTEEYKMRPGVTKAMMGTEKGTVRSVVPDDVMRQWLGDDVHAAIGSGYRSHAAFGDILEGYTAQAVRRINESNLENKQAKIRQLGEMIQQNFQKADGDFEFRVAKSHVDQSKFELIFSQDNLPERIKTQQVTGMLEGMDRIVPGGIDESVLDVEMRLAMQDENLHFLSLDQALGTKGAKFSASEIEKLDASGFQQTADWLRGNITTHNRVDRELMERGLAYDYMIRDAIDDPSAIGGGLPEDTAQFAQQQGYEYYTAADIDSDFRKLGRAPLDDARQSPYTYKKEAFAGTVLDPGVRSKGAFVDLPEPVTINVDDMTAAGREAADGTQRQIDRVFLPRPQPEIIDQGSELMIGGDLGRRQTDIMHNVARYEQARQGLIDADPSQIHSDLQRSVRRYYEDIGSDVMESKGAIQENVMSARLPASGRAKLQITSPALEVAAMDDDALREIQGNIMGDMDEEMLRRAREQDLDLTQVKRDVLDNIADTGLEPIDDPAIAYISEQRARDMLQGQNNIDSVINRMKGEVDDVVGQPALLHRDPLIHPTSSMPVHMRIGEGLDDDTVRIPATLAEGYFGDADGDNISFAMVGQTDAEQFGRDIDRTRELLTTTSYDSTTHPLAGTRTGVAQHNVMGSMFEDMAKGSPADILRDQKMIRNMDIDITDTTQFADQLGRAKVGRQVYTGTLTNLADQYRRVGRDVLQTDEQMQAFRSAVGSLIEEPISAKHWMTGTAKGTAGFDPKQAYDVLQDVAQGGEPTQIGQVLGTQGAGILQPAEVDAITEVARTAPDELSKMGNEMWQSTRALRRNQESMWRAMYSKTARTPTEEWDTFAGQYWDTMLESTPYEGTNMSEQLRERAQELTERGKRARQAKAKGGAKIGAKLSGEAETLMRRSPLGMKTTAALALGAGVFAGQMSTAGRSLPMDETDDPALNPVPDTADRATNLQIGEQQAIDIMAERTERMRINADRTRGANSINTMDLSQHGDMGYELSISGDTTIGKSPEELGAIVERAMHQTTEVPLNISVSTTDNRQEITEDWMESRLINLVS